MGDVGNTSPDGYPLSYQSKMYTQFVTPLQLVCYLDTRD